MTAHGAAQCVRNLNLDVKLPFIAAEEDTGPIVKPLVQKSAGENVIGCREWSNLCEIIEAFTLATGKKAEHVLLPKGQSRIPVPPELVIEMKTGLTATSSDMKDNMILISFAPKI
ncbi:uncharacterized protein EAE97_005536 [Botrytis byssoidea]|uniref:Uncharacterized protein n=1 Tax=Botrytis byssoidea TaxID=139641 RepID=A0A9P5ITG2_9HELO|nr:uncharacterized protein EAE97_005536 [Botrytis byssoidea]KAF7944903.1 hypothetical protein EAE97_005536 [Botrytis byssoidea]